MMYHHYGSKPILRNLNFTVKRSNHHVCWASGAGKSSIVNLLPRLYRVDSGVYLDDYD